MYRKRMEECGKWLWVVLYFMVAEQKYQIDRGSVCFMRLDEARRTCLFRAVGITKMKYIEVCTER